MGYGRTLTNITLWVIVSWICSSSYAEPGESSAIRISRIDIDGLKRTHRIVVERELLYKPGDDVTHKEIDESLRRLRNLQLFASIDHELRSESSGDGRVYASRIAVKEKWTTIPIFKVNSGGGVSQYILGVYDPNVFGRFWEIGGQYERLGDTNSGVVWMRNPRLLGERVGVGVDVWSTNRLRILYRDEGRSDEIESGFLHSRRRFSAFVGREWAWWIETKVVGEYHEDTFSQQYVPEDIASDEENPEEVKAVLSGFDFRFGRLNYQSELVDGAELTYRVRRCLTVDGGSARFTSHENEAKAFKTVFGKSTIGTHLAAGTNDADGEQDLFYLGGLDRLRGFEDARFRGRRYWLANNELRVPSYRSGDFVLQHTIFYDVAGVPHDDEKLTSASGSSVGVGLRAISPRIYRLALRLDYARVIEGTGGMPFSFGVQQFF